MSVTKTTNTVNREPASNSRFPVVLYYLINLFYSHSIALKQFRVGIIICTICGVFDYLIYPYSPAYIPSCYNFVISVDNSERI